MITDLRIQNVPKGDSRQQMSKKTPEVPTKFNLMDAPPEILLGILTYLVSRAEGKRIDLSMTEAKKQAIEDEVKDNSMYFIFENIDDDNAAIYLERVPDPYEN